MKLEIYQRKVDKKSERSLIRQRGDIPAILYSKGKENKTIAVNGADFRGHLRAIKPGHLPTTVFTIKGDSVSCKVVVKDIHYESTTYNIQHLDLLELDDNQPININVPIRFVGVADCQGIKLGGFLRQVIRHVKVKCKPKDLPDEFTMDVKDLGIKQSKRVRDIVMPSGVKALAPLNEVVVVIAKR